MRILVAGLLVSAAFGAAAVPADACGDKLLVIGRRVKRVPQARHPATVLLYLRPGSALPNAADEMHLEFILSQAGHRVETANGSESLSRRLAEGGYDFVLTDLPDAESVAGEADAAPGSPMVVPVAEGVDDAILGSYAVVIEVGRSRSYLSALDGAMGERARH
jgi:hypothetical protein